LGGVISEFKKVVTKKSGAEMAFIKISDGTSPIEAVVFPKTYALSKEFLAKDEVVIIIGRIDRREDSLSIVVEDISLFDPATQAKINKSILISVPKGTDVQLLQQINRTLRQFPGELDVAILLPNGGNELKKMVLPFSVSFDQTLETQITKLLGEGCFKVV